MPRFIVEADGGSRGNPGPAGYGALVRDAETGIVLAERSESIGTATNNVAEYNGLIAGLRAAAEIDPRADVEVRMDSKLVVEQMSGRWKVKHPDMKPLALTAAEAARPFPRVSYTWVPRERNKDADRLANEAMDRAAGRPSAGRRLDPKPAPAPATGWRTGQGQPTITLLLRHGQTPLSADKRFAGIGDIELTEAGMRQAKLAGERLAARGGMDVIVTSPLRRARETAAEVSAATGAPVVADEDLRETDFGAWEGLTFAEAQQQWPDEVTTWLGDPGTAPPQGESFTEVGVRVRAALARLLDRYAGQTVLVVSHVTPIKTLLTEALLAPPAALHRMFLDVGSLSEIHWFSDGPAVVRSLNDTGHLR
ncbi:MAG TPA: bifunctional RNase H/acid phosphatase [Streptosporangiaceae bacterium]|jgi:probable phosphoglycerate mutase|nr:bifunctional RNase H/acid phosphatase [Streptosporangiaceae bacterium]